MGNHHPTYLDNPWILVTINQTTMALTLSAYDQSMLAGEYGPAAQLAINIVIRMAQVYGAAELLDISGAHIDSTIYIGEAGLEFAERLASLGARVVVPTTLNVSGLDEHGWQEWAVPVGVGRESTPPDAGISEYGLHPNLDVRSVPD